jgi:hypothetical protein
MRKFPTAFAVLVTVAVVGCEAGPAEVRDPPVLTISSPARGLVQGQAGTVMVSGTVTPNANGDPIEKVLVNNVAAVLDHGAFHAAVEVREGAMLIETVVRDANGTTVRDTRAIQAGRLRAVGAPITSAVTAALSADAFAKLSAAAGTLIKGIDLAALLAPLQPIAHVNDPDGEDCAFARLFVDDVELTDVQVELLPVSGGVAFRAELDGLRVTSHARYALLCADGMTTVQLAADRIVIAGQLDIAPNGTAGFSTKLVDPDVELTGLEVDASGLPGDLLKLFNFNSVLQLIASKAAELAMGPLVNQALGALAGPQQIDVLGKLLTLQVSPAAITLEPSGAIVALNVAALLAGGESSPGFIYTDNGVPTLDASTGFQLGLADDLANELMAEAQASGLLDLSLATPGGAFDTAAVHMKLPPMISADGTNGALHVVLGDMQATFISHGTPVASAAISATIDLRVISTNNGYGVALELGTPDLHLDILDDVANTTGIDNASLAAAAASGLAVQIETLSKLLRAIPIPAIAGLQMRDLSIGADSGYVMVNGRFD